MSELLGARMSPPDPKAIRIELRESSGPVSPRFRFGVVLRLIGDAAGATVEWERTAGVSPTARGAERLHGDAVRALVNDLVALGVRESAADLVGSENRSRKGVSFNFFEVDLGDGPVRCDYLLTQIEEPENARLRSIVERLKQLVPA